MEREYNVGDSVWWASCGTRQVKKTCPVCYGKCKVVLVLGNDEEVQTDCDYCRRGYEGPYGYIQEYEWVADVKNIVIEGKEVSEGPNGRSVEYRNDHYILRDGVIFSEKEEAEAAVQDMIRQNEVDQQKNLESRKDNSLKSYSWHVGYHQRELKKAEAQVAYHSKKIVSMKARTKEEKLTPTTN